MASISAALSLLVGGLLFAEHDASAQNPLAEFGILDQTINLGTSPTTQTGSLDQAVVFDGFNVDQTINFSRPTTGAPLNCADFLAAQAVLGITQSIQFACPAVSG